MEPGARTDIDPVGIEPVNEEPGNGDGVRAVLARRRDGAGEQEFTVGLESHIILGED